MNPAVQGYTAAVVDATTEATTSALWSDVAAVDRLLRRNAELHAALTDVVVPPRARQMVLAELLSGKVSPSAARLCAYVAGAVHAQEVPAAITWVANRLRQVAEHTTETEELLGHREARERVGGYAAAVFEDLSAAELETVEDELFRFARIVGATPELRAALSDRDLPTALRRAVVGDLLSDKVLPATLRIAEYVVVGGRPRDVTATLDWLVEQVAIARGWRVARVHAGQRVDEEERRHLSDTLSRLVGSPVELQVTVDPALLAGVVVEVGDLQLDATARGRLERLREHVVTGGWTDLGFGRLERSAHHVGVEEPGVGAADRATDRGIEGELRS
ncbi:MAG TPA: F0F1 ATP synthase subunit delta [Acidimicrobiales bacterium]|nr:F0F1 ATP synthase subunit delta [Acidimicrobiales bacterium]